MDADRKAQAAELDALKTSLDRITRERAELVASLDRQVLALFEMVSKRRNGVAVAEARGGICTICHVRLRPQVFNTVLRNEQIIQCDHCNRILYFSQPRPRRAAADNLSPQPDLMEVVAYIDGGARGNPGPAGYGVRIEQPDGTLVEEFWESIGVATNNVAEYRGLLAALEWASAHDRRHLRVRSDSQLLVQQMLGNYKVKHPGLQPLHAQGTAARPRDRPRRIRARAA